MVAHSIEWITAVSLPGGEISFLGSVSQSPKEIQAKSYDHRGTPTQVQEDECDQWFPLALEQGNDDEEEEI